MKEEAEIETREEMEEMGGGGGGEGTDIWEWKKTLEEEQEKKKGKMCSDCLLYRARYVLHYYIQMGSMFVINRASGYSYIECARGIHCECVHLA